LSGFNLVSPSAQEDWDTDVLGAEVALPGETWRISFARFNEGTCAYDVKVIFTDHDELRAFGFDLCATSVIELGADDVFYYR